MDWCGECVNERPPARTPSNSHRVPVWPAWDTAYGRSRCAKKELFFSLSSLSFQASAVANKEIDVPSFFLMNDFNSDLHRRGVNIPYVKSVKIRALAEWDNQFFFFCAWWIFTGLFPVPRVVNVVIERSSIVDHGFITTRGSRQSDREISPTCEEFSMCFSLRVPFIGKWDNAPLLR